MNKALSENKASPIKISLPLSDEIISKLHAGDTVLLSGYVYTARDAAHKRLSALIKDCLPLPFNIEGETVYYVGPSPARPGCVVGSAGPTSSCRMDVFTPDLLDMGLKAMIGKGKRSTDVIKSIVKNHCIYFAAVGGAGAVLSKSITSLEPVCYAELGTEAVQRFLLKDFPCVVAIDAYGANIYEYNK